MFLYYKLVYIFVPTIRTIKAMDKPTKKRANYNTTVVDRLKEKYGVSKRFITMSLSGDRESETSEAIKKDYKTMLKEVNNVLKAL